MLLLFYIIWKRKNKMFEYLYFSLPFIMNLSFKTDTFKRFSEMWCSSAMFTEHLKAKFKFKCKGI